MIRLYCSLICIGWLTAVTASETAPLVTTNYGTIRGRRMTVKKTNRSVNAYLSIPYARSPTGHLRFALPQAPEPWDGIRDGTRHPPMCTQLSLLRAHQNMLFSQTTPEVNISEDCLFLNVYVPADDGEHSKSGKKSVMVFFHGGAFIFGAASMYDGSGLAAFGDNVMVIAQYRLGVLGFCSTGDKRAPGNFGLRDQVQVLQWVKENIHHFRGDPNCVTIFGQSAGGISVSALLLSPMANGFYHRVIAQSGTALMYGLIYPDREAAIALSNMVANATGCLKDNSPDMDCLRSKTAEEVNKPLESGAPLLLPAMEDGVLLAESPDKLLAAKKVNNVPIIVGYNLDECAFWLPSATQNGPFPNGIKKEEIDNYLLHQSVFEGGTAKYSDQIVEKYVGQETDPIKIREDLFKMCRDSMFRIPAIRTANYLKECGIPVYVYEFNRQPSINKNIKPSYVGADHGDELPFVFGSMFFNGDVQIRGNFTEEEEVFSRKMMKIWDNFADTGNPNSEDLPEWPAWDVDQQYLTMGAEFGTETLDFQDLMEFWEKEIYSKMNAGQTG